jgi:nitrogen regulatory protein PII
MSKITYLTDSWLITCVVSSATKQSEKMLLAARDAGAKGAVGHYAKGYGARERLGALGIAVETDKTVFALLVSSEQRDIVVEAMFKAGELDRPGAGYIYVMPIERLATFIPESIMSRLREDNRVRQAL